MKNKKYVTPSLLNVEPTERANMAKTLIAEGIKWIHYDVMDGQFVPNTAITLAEIKEIKKQAPKHMMDAHMMVVNPLAYLDDFKDVVDIFTFHYEAIKPTSLLALLKEKHHEYRFGLAIKPETDVSKIVKFLPYLSLVLVMSVEPGAGGQKFMEKSLEKINELYKIRNKNAYQYLIQVDGGINNETGPKAFKAGVDACVAGTFLIKDPSKKQINSIINGN
ncbi:ribulose-phosphate 3-epimerase [Mycoplasmopsis opalescens]|uniref:ribulose-phosphate 3-epimerase n=1 Tax=Mycoplasmopsis opalescens TaxID=114886 RepID=UPI0004A76A40|nr:ribulose-phosphate 3-epimerase [Mycoplasmopsis opalescens]